jgi:hypothetical protein
MRLLVLTAIILESCVTICCGADAGPAAITWSTPTNRLPEKLWVYKVIPQNFSEAVVSNLMSLGSFTIRDRKKVSPYLHEEDSGTLFFGDLEGTQKHLAICPKLGYVEFHDGKAASSSQLHPVIGVPDQDETMRLGLKYLRLVGIDISQIATKPGSLDLDVRYQRETLAYTDQKTKEEIALTNVFGVWFARSIDGLKVGGYGGMDVSFGNNAKVTDLRLCWRNLVPFELHDCPSMPQITDWIKSGQIRLRVEKTGEMIRLSDLKKLTVVKATPLYYGKNEDEPADFVFPYVDCQAVAESEKGTNTVSFQSPLTLSKANWQVVK